MASSVQQHGRKYRVKWRLLDGTEQRLSAYDQAEMRRFKLWLENDVDESAIGQDDVRILRKVYLTGGGPASTLSTAETLAGLCESWIDSRRIEAGINQNTVRNYRARIKRLRALGDAHKDTVTDVMLADFRKDLQTQIMPGMKAVYSANVVRETMAFLSSVYGWAYAEGKVERNPAARMVLPPGGTKKESKFLEVEEFEKLLTFAPCVEVEEAVETLVDSGLRIGEFLALRANDIYIEDGFYTLRVDESLSAESTYGPTKTTHANRSLILLPGLGERLLTRALSCASEEDPLFPHPANGGVWSVEAFRHQWEQMTTAARIGGMRFRKGVPTPHWLRHSHAAWLLTSKEPVGLYELSQRLGHSSISITADMYGHIPRAARAKMLTALKYR